MTLPRSAAQTSRRRLGAAIALGAFATQAFAQPAELPRGAPGHSRGDGAGMGHGVRERMMQDPAMQERMLERRTSHMLDAVQATPEQRSKIMGIAKAAYKDIAPLRQQQRTSREKGRAMMFAASIDRAGLEKLRTDQMKLRDAMSLRTLAGMLDAMATLSAEQRAMLAQRKRGAGMMQREGAWR